MLHHEALYHKWYCEGDGLSGRILSIFMVRKNLFNTPARKEKSLWILQCFFFCFFLLLLLPINSHIILTWKQTIFPQALHNNDSFLASLWRKIYSTAPQIIADDKLNENLYLWVLMLRPSSVFSCCPWPFLLQVHTEANFKFSECYLKHDEPCSLFSPGVWLQFLQETRWLPHNHIMFDLHSD